MKTQFWHCLKQGQLKWKREVFEVREDINVSEWVYGHDGTVSWSFLDTEQRMAELNLVHVKKVYWPCWGNVNIINTCVTYTKSTRLHHIKPTGAVWLWKPVPWSSWCLVSVLMMMPEDVWSSAVSDSAKHWWLLHTLWHCSGAWHNVVAEFLWFISTFTLK